jgi:hypothetical protein
MLAYPASAAPLDAADKGKLEGVWRRNANPQSDACGTDGNFQYGVEITIEFKLTGGEIYFEDQAEGSGGDKITSATKADNTIFLKLADRSPAWDIKFTGEDKAAFYGQAFTRCDAAEPRTTIALAKGDVAYLATGLVPAATDPFYGAYFVDTRDVGGCKAKFYQALAFDLRNPTAPALLRFESAWLKEKTDAGKKPGIPLDDDGMGRWLIAGAAKTATGWNFKLTELIPPNGSRGDIVPVDIQRTRTGIAIPAWKRSYTRCVFSDG